MKDPKIIELFEVALQIILAIDFLNTDLAFVNSPAIEHFVSQDSLRKVNDDLVFDKFVFLKGYNSKEGKLSIQKLLFYEKAFFWERFFEICVFLKLIISSFG